MELLLGRELRADEITATDLSEEIRTLEQSGQSFSCHNVVTENSQGFIENAGQMLYVPEIGRAGICLGADSQWTDATGPEDALIRHNNDEMVN